MENEAVCTEMNTIKMYERNMYISYTMYIQKLFGYRYNLFTEY